MPPREHVIDATPFSKKAVICLATDNGLAVVALPLPKVVAASIGRLAGKAAVVVLTAARPSSIIGRRLARACKPRMDSPAVPRQVGPLRRTRSCVSSMPSATRELAAWHGLAFRL